MTSPEPKDELTPVQELMLDLLDWYSGDWPDDISEGTRFAAVQKDLEALIASEVTKAVKAVIETEYEAPYSKNDKCALCDQWQFNHSPDSHFEYGADQLRKLQRAKLKSLTQEAGE